MLESLWASIQLFQRKYWHFTVNMTKTLQVRKILVSDQKKTLSIVTHAAQTVSHTKSNWNNSHALLTISKIPHNIELLR